MQMTTKTAGVQFTHDDTYRGEVTISRGTDTLVVPMDALRKIVAEAVRHDLVQRVGSLKPEALLRGMV